MIDNYDHIYPLLDFSNPDLFYFVQVYQRKKDHTDRKVNGTNNNNRLIRPYFVHNKEYLNFIMPELVEMANVFKARVGIDLNRRSFEKMAFLNLKKVTDQIMNKEYNHVYKSYPSVVGKNTHEPNKKWILDIDGKTLDKGEMDEFNRSLRGIAPVRWKILGRIPSLNGEHIITSPFNVKEAEPLLKEFNIDVHKKNPTNLYIPKI